MSLALSKLQQFFEHEVHCDAALPAKDHIEIAAEARRNQQQLLVRKLIERFSH